MQYMGLCAVVCCLGIIALLFLGIFSFSFAWIPWIMNHCHKSPGIWLENLTIRKMTIYQNNATADLPWQVNSEFNVTFSMWNTNTVARCFTTYRTMYVDVRFKNNLIVRQEVSLGFSLKPKNDRLVEMELKGDHFLLKKDLVPVMEANLQSGNVTLEFFFYTRYLIADRRSRWMQFGCSIVAKSPLVKIPDLKTLVTQKCYDI